MIRIDSPHNTAAAWNAGVEQSRGELLIFADNSIEFLAQDFSARLMEHMTHCDVLGVCGTSLLCGGNWIGAGLPFVYGQVAVTDPQMAGWISVLLWSVAGRRADGMQALDGMFLCAHRRVFERIRFDQESFGGKYLFDIDFSYRTYLAGYRLSVASDLYPIRAGIPQRDEEMAHAEAHFNAKHKERLPVGLHREFQSGVVAVPDRADIVDVMTPPHWRGK